MRSRNRNNKPNGGTTRPLPNSTATVGVAPLPWIYLVEHGVRVSRRNISQRTA